MPRLRNTRTGAVVSCSEATAARLGRGWEPADTAPVIDPEPVQPARRPARKRTPKRTAQQ